MIIPADSHALLLDGMLVAASTIDGARALAAAVLPGASPADWRDVSSALSAPASVAVDATGDVVRVLDGTPSAHPWHFDREDLQALADAVGRPVRLYLPEAA
ncbi:MAG: hypothetical protein KBB14_06285 [Thermoanaerobaculia bacterium]|nr:hypothetical protein [Thermoanaerobaculia bacterium]